MNLDVPEHELPAISRLPAFGIGAEAIPTATDLDRFRRPGPESRHRDTCNANSDSPIIDGVAVNPEQSRVAKFEKGAHGPDAGIGRLDRKSVV